jgi:hypothetical protein
MTEKGRESPRISMVSSITMQEDMLSTPGQSTLDTSDSAAAAAGGAGFDATVEIATKQLDG